MFGLSLITTSGIYAEDEDDMNIYDERLALYKKTAAITNVPWYYLAAMDHYERNIQQTSPEEEDIISIHLNRNYGMALAILISMQI